MKSRMVFGLLCLNSLWLISLFPERVPARLASIDKPFLMFDATSYHGKPDLRPYGLIPVNMVYVSRFGESWYKGPLKDQLPDERAVKRVAQATATKGGLTVIDIEHWSLRGDDTAVRENVDKYVRLLTWFREEAPGLKLGYFGIVPIAAYGWSLMGSASVEYRQWQGENDRLRPLAEAVDVVLPYTYTYYADRQAWVKFAIENVKEAKRYGKPVYVFLWPQYTDTATHDALHYIPADYWKLQLETIRKHADGLIIWGGWGDGKPAEWDENAPWWNVTKEFLGTVKHGSPRAPNGLAIQ